MPEPKETPSETVDAVLALLNAGSNAEIKQLFASSRDALSGKQADHVIQQLIDKHRDDKEDLAHLRSRRMLLHRLLEYGADEAFSKSDAPAALQDVVMGFVNMHDTSELMKFVESHREALMSHEADEVLGSLLVQYRDDLQIQAHVKKRRELISAVRQRGVAEAFSGELISVSKDLAEAMFSFLTAVSPEDLRRALESNQDELLTDQGERMLAFMSDAATAGGDERAPLMRLRLDLMRRCRIDGIAKTLDPAHLERAMAQWNVDAPSGVPQSSIELDALLSDELAELARIDGSIPEEALRTLFERRPELIGAFRERVSQGKASWTPAPDRAVLFELLKQVTAAQTAGAWERLMQLRVELLQRVSADADPLAAALVHSELGTALSRNPQGDRAQNLDLAIEHHEMGRQAFRGLSPAGLSEFWERNEHHLALALLQRVRGDRSESVEKSIAIWRNLIESSSELVRRSEWETSLAEALRQRTTGDHLLNRQEAIRILRAVIARSESAGNTETATRAGVALGLCLFDHTEGDPADNIEQSIDQMTRNLSAIDPSTDPNSWCNIQRNLAHIYTLRKQGDPQGNWQDARTRLRLVLDICPRDRFPEQWAETTLALASLTGNPPQGRTISSTLDGAAAMAEALEVYTWSDYPDRWAKVQVNLASLYAAIFATSDGTSGGEYFLKAVSHAESSFRVYTRDGAPDRWAMAHHALGQLYLHRAELSSDEDRWSIAQKSIDHFELALQVRSLTSDPSGRLETLKNLVMLNFRHQEWHAALDWCAQGMRAADRLLGVTHTEVGRLSEVSESDWLYVPAAYCLFRLNDPRASLTCLEWGKSRILAQALALRDLDIAQLPEAQFQQIFSLRQAVRQLERAMREQQEEAPAVLAKLGRSLRTAREELGGKIAEASAAHPQLPQSRLEADQILETVPAGGAVVIPLVTEEGTLVYVLVRNARGGLDFLHVSIDWLDKRLLRHYLVGTAEEPGWRTQYRAWREGRGTMKAWRAAVQSGLASIWQCLLEPVSAALDRRLPEGAPVTIVPPGELMFLPFHAAGESESRCFLDRYTVSYCPSLYTLRASQRRLLARHRDRVKALAVVNPTTDLPFSEGEADCLEDLLPSDALRVFRGSEAKRMDVETAARQVTHLHFASHGVYDAANIMNSGLVLSDSMLTLGAILGSDLDLTAARVVVLSACDSGLIDLNFSPDEFIGLPTAFLEGGACGVVSTLWPVADRATSLLIRRFYEGHLRDGLSPAGALRRAQLWLRDATRGEIADYYRSLGDARGEDVHDAFMELTLGGARDDHPYAHPYYWGAFQFTGA